MMAPEDVVVRMGGCVLGDNEETLAALGVECGAMLEVVIDHEAVEQKVEGVYAATEVAVIESKEAAREEQRLREERRREERRQREEQQREERRLREEQERQERERREREREQYRPLWLIFKTNFQAFPQYVEYCEKQRKRREIERERQEEGKREEVKRRRKARMEEAAAAKGGIRKEAERAERERKKGRNCPLTLLP